jgi:hypothetical protein
MDKKTKHYNILTDEHIYQLLDRDHYIERLIVKIIRNKIRVGIE